MAVVFGVNCKLYRNTGSHGSPVWNLVDQVKDCKIPLSAGEAEATTRLNGGFKASEPVMIDAGIEWEMPWDAADLDLGVFQAAFFARTGIEFAVCDGLIATVGTQYLIATMKLFDFSIDESLEQVRNVSLKAKPCLAAQAPAWVTVAA